MPKRAQRQLIKSQVVSQIPHYDGQRNDTFGAYFCSAGTAWELASLAFDKEQGELFNSKLQGGSVV